MNNRLRSQHEQQAVDCGNLVSAFMGIIQDGRVTPTEAAGYMVKLHRVRGRARWIVYTQRVSSHIANTGRLDKNVGTLINEALRERARDVEAEIANDLSRLSVAKVEVESFVGNRDYSQQG